MKDKQARLDALLGELVSSDSILGAALVSRDGLAVKTAGKQDLSRETFSAMTATLAGAAEIALAEIDGGPPRSIVATTARVKLILIGATTDLLLVAYARSDASVEDVLQRVEKAAEAVAAIVSG